MVEASGELAVVGDAAAADAAASDLARRARFIVLYRSTYDRVLAYSARRTRDAHSAHDIVAESFMTVWRRIDDVPSPPGDVPWVFGVARRTIANHRRGASRRARLLERLASRAADSDRFVPSASEIVERHSGPELAAAFAQLSEEQQELLLLSEWDELSHAEIGALIGCSENAATKRVVRARDALRSRFTELADHEAPSPTPTGTRSKVRRISP